MLLMTLVILADAYAGQPLMRTSILAAAGTGGARFYGIGNEYMGFLIAATSGLVCLSRVRPNAVLLTGLLVVMTLGAGNVGANAGGVITATATFAAAFTVARRSSLGPRSAVLCVLLGLAAAGLFALVDAFLAGPSASHLGSAITRAHSGGGSILWAIVQRKVAMGIGVIASWPGALALTAALALGAIAFLAFRSDLEAVAHAYPGWRSWHPVAATGAVTAFVFNDTGMVPMLIIYGSFVLIGLTLRFSMEPQASPQELSGA
jgi:hypothetical protein